MFLDDSCFSDTALRTHSIEVVCLTPEPKGFGFKSPNVYNWTVAPFYQRDRSHLGRGIYSQAERLMVQTPMSTGILQQTIYLLVTLDKRVCLENEK